MTEKTIEKRFINDISEIFDTYFGYMGTEEPSEREIKEKDYLLIGVARSQQDAESICEKLNEQNEELIHYSNFGWHIVLDKKNKEIEQLKQFRKKVFTLFDKEISRNEEALEWGKETGAGIGAVGFYNHMLKRLQKELKE